MEMNTFVVSLWEYYYVWEPWEVKKYEMHSGSAKGDPWHPES